MSEELLNDLTEEQKERLLSAEEKILNSSKTRTDLILAELSENKFLSILEIFKQLILKEKESEVKWQYNSVRVYLSKLVKERLVSCEKVKGKNRLKAYSLFVQPETVLEQEIQLEDAEETENGEND